MADERKYRDDEVDKIFDLAASRDEVGRPSLSDDDGLTLAELQEVGLEVGIGPERIARAATALDKRKDVLPRRKLLGMPISVGRIIELPRDVTDREWALMVAEFRETFGAKGRVTSGGGLREWSNGNLHAFLEPTETGHRLRLRTLKGSAVVLNRLGAFGLGMGLLILTALSLWGDLATEFATPVMLALMGAGALASNAITLPRWAREREEQMEYIAGRVSELVAAPPSEEK